MAPIVRRLSSADLPAFRELLLLWDDGDLICPLEELPAQVERARRESCGEVLVAQDEQGALCGYAQLGLHLMVGMGAAMELVALLVRPEHRGRGIGSALIGAGEDFARERNCSMLLLSSQLFRDRAHAFYLREGFREVKRSAFFCKDL
jgi:GNAT superfamily N-acetyltransferase